MSTPFPSAASASAPPREPHPRGHRGGPFGVRGLETMVLVLAGLLLAIATVNDVMRQTHVNHRLEADLQTWRAYTHHRYHNLSLSQDFRTLSTREIVCGNTSPGQPKQRVQLCLLISGPISHGLREVHGGWYLPPLAEDLRRYRYGCFGRAREEALCTR